jgi:hypothetical protein
VVRAKALPTVKSLLNLAGQTSEHKVRMMLEEPANR